MAGFIIKIILCPIAVFFASWVLPNVTFGAWYQPVTLGLIIGVIGYFLEVLILRRDTNWLTALLDFLIASAIVYFGSLIFVNSFVSFWGAVFSGAIVALIEVFQHYWLFYNIPPEEKATD